MFLLLLRNSAFWRDSLVMVCMFDGSCLSLLIFFFCHLLVLLPFTAAVAIVVFVAVVVAVALIVAVAVFAVVAVVACR